MTTPPCYVYLSKHRNYREAVEWYVVDASDAPLVDFKQIHNGVINRYNVTRKVLWCIECEDADGVALTLNEWLLSQPRPSAGVNPVAFKLQRSRDADKDDVERLKLMVREITKNF